MRWWRCCAPLVPASPRSPVIPGIWRRALTRSTTGSERWSFGLWLMAERGRPSRRRASPSSTIVSTDGGSERPAAGRWQDAPARRSITLPNISTGIFGYPMEVAARVAAETVRDASAMRVYGRLGFQRMLHLDFEPAPGVTVKGFRLSREAGH